MARRRTRRRFKRGYWSANIAEIQSLISATAGNFTSVQTLVTNPAQSTGTVSQIYTVKNVETTFEFDLQTNSGSIIEGIIAYIMYVPQGMTISNDYARLHPEYIMNYRFIGSPDLDTVPYRSPIKVKSRLARKLNTGDQIVLFITGRNPLPDVNLSMELNGLVRWWTKAN